MRLGIFTDIHGNLPALEALLTHLKQAGCDRLIHLGDAIGIGPFPAECVSLLLETPHLTCIMGNHDHWFVSGLPEPQPVWMSDEEVAHQRWTHAQLNEAQRVAMAAWGWKDKLTVDATTLHFMHYALQPNGGGFKTIVDQPTGQQLDELFGDVDAELLFYGHHHPDWDVTGRLRYINPGSAGCTPTAAAHYAIVDLQPAGVAVECEIVNYDDRSLWPAFQQRAVPERQFLAKIFFGGRW